MGLTLLIILGMFNSAHASDYAKTKMLCLFESPIEKIREDIKKLNISEEHKVEVSKYIIDSYVLKCLDNKFENSNN